MRRAVAAVAAGLVLAAAHLPSAQAAVVSVFTNRALSITPATFNLPGSVGSLSFTATTLLTGPGAAVATGGNAQVTSIFGGIADYEIGTVFDGTASFAASATPAQIPFSSADDLIGFTYTGTDGLHLGYAEVAGPTLIGYAYETTAGASIVGNSIAASTAVPEPASAALMGAAMAAVVGMSGRKRAAKRSC